MSVTLGSASRGRRGGAKVLDPASTITPEPGDCIKPLHVMFRVLGDQMTSRDLKVLKFLYSAVLPEDLLLRISDGFSFLLALERVGRVDETNLRHLRHLLKVITRHDLLQFLTLRKRKPVLTDAVSEYLERSTSTLTPFKRRKLDDTLDSPASPPPTSTPPTTFSSLTCSSASLSSAFHSSPPSADNSATDPMTPCTSSSSCATQETAVVGGQRPDLTKNRVYYSKGRVYYSEVAANTARSTAAAATVACSNAGGGGVGEEIGSSVKVDRDATTTAYVSSHCSETSLSSSAGTSTDVRIKQTCDIRLRVRAEYCDHASALDGNVHSNKDNLIERQFEKFTQANTILKSRDLGSIICDIKFSELTYLDAFWRDYINGSLQEALRSVFITESLKQAVGHEAIKLLVNVDEDDYEAGRLVLLSNLTNE